MNILVVCQNYYPEQFRINDICPELVRRGHNVTVLTGLPNYPEGRVPKEYKRHKKRYEEVNGVNVIRCFEIGRRKGKFFLCINYLSFLLSASLKARRLKNEYDVVFSYQLSPITMVKPAIICKKRFGIPLVLYCLDLWPESLKAVGIKQNSFIYKLLHAYSRRMYRKADLIAVTSPAFKDYMVEYNQVNPELISDLPQHAENSFLCVSAKQREDVTRFLFAGNIGMAQNIEGILYAVSKIKTTKKFSVDFVGDGSFYKQAQQLIVKLGITDKVKFLGKRPFQEMTEYYAKADAYILSLAGNCGVLSDTIPGKLQGYMAAGRPIFGLISGEANKLISEECLGGCVQPDDIEGFAKLLQDFIEKPQQYEGAGQRARNYYFKKFTLKAYMDYLLRLFEKSIGGPHV